jgi:drug/metabolite transporter (DMT)-like permease
VLLVYGGKDLAHVPWSELNWITWINLVQVVFCSGVLAFVCFYEGVRQIGTGRATMYQFFVPILATFFGILILKQLPTLFQVGGLCVVISGVWMASVARNRAANRLAQVVE